MLRAFRLGAGVMAMGLVSIVPSAGADEFVIDKENSLIGFVHHKRGVASFFVEDPLSYPVDYSMRIDFDPSLDTTSFELQYDAKSIQVADKDVLGRWGQAILDSGATKKALKASSSSVQRRIRKAILSEKLLDVAKYPEIRVRSLGVSAVSGGTHTHELTIEIRMHGEVREATFPATLLHEGDRMTVSAAFPLRMTDFKIKPYSAFFGALRFEDEFYVFMHLEAERKY